MAQAATLTALCGLVAISVGFTTPVQAQSDDAPERECVRIMNINGYSTLDDQHLLLDSGASRHYLVTTRNACYGLQYGVQVGLSFPERTRICNASLEYLVVPDGGRCRISTIEEVEDADAARALISERASAASDGESR